MQANQEIQDFTRFGQNTHQATVSTSTAAAVLLTLGHKQKEDFQRKKEQQAASGKSERLDLFSDEEKAACREDIQRFFQAALECSLLHEALGSIEKKAAIQALKESIGQRLIYPPQTDPISIYIGGEVYLVTIPLQVVLGLVARATLNSEVLDQGKTPEQTKKDRDARILTLYHACNRWSSNNVCSHGFFNDLVYALDRIWPGIHLIGPMLPFIESIAREFITKRLQDQPDFFIILKAFALGDNRPWERFLQEIKEETNRQVRAGIEKNGLNPDAPDVAKNRSDFFEAFEDLDPYWDITQWTRHIEGIGNLKSDNDGGSIREAAIKKAKQILQDCISFADFEKTNLRQLLAVERVYQLALKAYKKNATTQLKLFAEIIENALTQARNCFAVFAKGELLQDTNVAEFEIFFEGISAALSDVPQVENFIALWFNPESDEQGKQSLCKKLSVRNPRLDQAMEKHFKMLLEKRIDRQGQPILDLWDVNSIIFTAIFQSPKNWSDNLNTLVKYSIALIENIFAGKAAAGTELVATYPREKMQELIEELRLLVDIHQACKSTRSEGPDLFQRLVVFPIIPNLQEVPRPVLNLIAGKINSLDFLKGLPLQFIEQLITPEGWHALLAATITTIEDLKKLSGFSKDVQEKLIDAVPDERWTALAQSLTFDQWLKLGEIPAEVREKLIAAIDAVPDERWTALAQSLTFDQWLKSGKIPAEAVRKLVTADVPRDKWGELAQSLTFDQWLKSGEIPVEAVRKLVTVDVPRNKWKELAQSLTFDQWLKSGKIPAKVVEKLIDAVPDERWTALAQSLTFDQWLKSGKIPVKVLEKLIDAVPDERWTALAQSLTFDQWLKSGEIPVEAVRKLVTADVPRDKWGELAQSLTFDQWLKWGALPLGVPEKLIDAVPDERWTALAQSLTVEQLLEWDTLLPKVKQKLIDTIYATSNFEFEQLRSFPDEIQILFIQTANSCTPSLENNQKRISYIFQLLQSSQLLRNSRRLPDCGLGWGNSRPFIIRDVLRKLRSESRRVTGEGQMQMIVDAIVESIDYFPRLQQSALRVELILQNKDLLFGSIANTINFKQLLQLKHLPAKIRKPLTETILRNPSTLDRIARSEAINFDRLQQLKQLPAKVRKPLIKAISQNPSTLDRIAQSDVINFRQLQQLNHLPAKIRKPLIKAISQNPSTLDRIARSEELSGKEFSPQELNQIPRKIRNPFIAAMGRAVAEKKMHYDYGFEVKQRSILRRILGVVVGVGAILLGGELFLTGALFTATLIGSPIGVPLMAAAAGVIGMGMAAVASAIGISSAVAATTAVVATGGATAIAGTGIAAGGAQEIVGTTRDLLLKHRLGKVADVDDMNKDIWGVDRKPQSIMRGARLHISRPFFEGCGNMRGSCASRRIDLGDFQDGNFGPIP